MTNRVLQIRSEQSMTQRELAEAAGVSRPYLCDLENNRRGAKPETWERIANVLGVSVDELIAE